MTQGKEVSWIYRIDLSRHCASPERMMVGISGSSPGQCEPVTGISKPNHCCYTSSSSPSLDSRRPDDAMFCGFSPFLPQSVGTLTFQGGRRRISLGASTKNQFLMLSDKCIQQLHGEDTNCTGKTPKGTARHTRSKCVLIKCPLC